MWISQTFFNKHQKIKLLQIIHASQKQWCEIVATYYDNLNNFFVGSWFDWKKIVYALGKLASKELYKVQVLLKYTESTSQHYFEKRFSQSNNDWKKNYILPRIVTADNRIWLFQYKLLNNILFFNKILTWNSIMVSLLILQLWRINSISYFLWLYSHTKKLSNQLQTLICGNLVIPCLTPQSSTFDFMDTQQENPVIINRLPLLFKFTVYKSRDLKTLNFLSLEADVINKRQIEENLCRKNIQKQRKYFKKWGKLINLFCHWTMYWFGKEDAFHCKCF